MTNDIYTAEISTFIQATSTSNITIGTGVFMFVLDKDIKFFERMTVTADAGSGNDMTGTVDFYDKDTKTVTIDVTSFNGSGTFSSWNIDGATTLYFANAGRFSTKPTETPISEVFEPRIIDPGNFEINLFRKGTTRGRSEVGFGALILNNADGKLDNLIEYGFDDRQLIVRRGVQGEAYPTDFKTLINGTMQLPEFTINSINFRIRDKQAEVANKPISATKYLGNNVLPSGVEGVPGDLKGKPKPLLKGRAFNFAPPQVNSSKLTYQVSYEQISDIDKVYDQGVSLVKDVTHPTLAALQAASVANGKYDLYLGSGGDGAFFRLGASPNGQVTCDALQGVAAADRTAAQLADDVIINQGGSGGFEATSISDLDTKNSSVIGLWVGTDERTVGEILDQLLSSVGASWYVDRDGTFKVARLEDPSGTPVETYKSAFLLGNAKFNRIATNDSDNGLPINKVNLKYEKNFAVQRDSDLAGSVTQARRNFLKQQFRTISSSDAAVLTLHPLAEEIEIETLLTVEANATTEASRLLGIYKVRHDMLEVDLPNELVDNVNLNDVISLDVERFDFLGGKLFRVLGIVDQFAQDRTTLTVWG